MREKNEPKWRRYLRFARPNPPGDLDDELRDHIESTVDSLVAKGMSPDSARAEALRRFGDPNRVKGEVSVIDARHQRSENRAAVVETLLYDLRHAARGLRRSPGFAFVAALSLALGVAANSTVFSVVNALLLRPIPGAHGDRLMRMYVNHHSPFDWGTLDWFRANARTLESVVGERNAAMSFRRSPSDESERVNASYVTRGFFPTLGVRMALGAGFDGDDTGEGAAPPVAVLSYPFWVSRFGADSAVIGSTILINDQRLTVVGVAAADFRSSVMVWAPNVIMPLSVAPLITGRPVTEFGGSFYTTVRLREGITASQSAGELRVLMPQLARTDSVRYERQTVRLDHVRGVNAELREPVAAASVFLMIMVALVLLIACANVANLLLGRAATRRAEIGVRLAIGASRSRLVRQMLTESLLLAAVGTAIGFAASWVLTRVMTVAIPAELGLGSEYFAPDARVLLFTALLCLVTTILFGALPALRAASPDLVGLLKGSDAQSRLRKRGWLVATQTAMCVLLLAVAATFLRSLASMRGLDPGFQSQGVVDVAIDLRLAGESPAVPTFDRIVSAARTMPGVESAALTAIVPLSGSNMETRVLPEGQSVASPRDAPMTYFHIVGDGYFATLRIPLRRGREFAAADREGSPRVAIVNESAARRFFPAGDALGKRLHWGGLDGPLMEIVGIAPDVDYVMPGEQPKVTVYVPFAQEPRGEMVLQMRTGADLAATRRAVWDVLRGMLPSLPLPPVTRMTDDMAVTLLPVRLGAALLGAFGALALILAAAGIYGVAAYSVARRTREIGIRAALGASRARLVRMVLWESGQRVGTGALVGLTATVGVSVLLSSALYGVRPLDPLVLGGVAGLIIVVALLSSVVPARRAARTNPVIAMRSE